MPRADAAIRAAARDFADGIIEAQVREIGEMKQLIAHLEQNPLPDGAAGPPPRPAQ